MHRRDLCQYVRATKQAAWPIPLPKGLHPQQHTLQGGAEYAYVPSEAIYSGLEGVSLVSFSLIGEQTPNIAGRVVIL